MWRLSTDFSTPASGNVSFEMLQAGVSQKNCESYQSVPRLTKKCCCDTAIDPWVCSMLCAVDWNKTKLGVLSSAEAAAMHQQHVDATFWETLMPPITVLEV